MSKNLAKRWRELALLLGVSHLMPASPVLPRRIFPSQDYSAIRTTRQYFALLHAADSATFRNELEDEFLLLLNKPQRRAYDSLTFAGRKAFVALFWKVNDPNPLQPENDRLAVHLQRRAHARQNFPSTAPPYFDDRGKYYLKYGRPAARYEDAGGQRRVGFFSPNMYRLVQRMYAFKLAPEQYYTVTANESWSYQNMASDFVVHFVKDGSTYREIESLTEIITSRQRKNIAWQWSDMVKQRAALSPLLARTAQQIEQFESTLIYAANARRGPGLLRDETQAFNERLLSIESNIDNDTGKARRNLPPAIYEPLHVPNQLALHHRVAQFRGPNGATRIETTLLAPLHQNLVEQLDSLQTDTIAVEFAWMLRDQNFDSLTVQRWQNIFPATIAAREDLPNAVGRLSFLLPPQQVELTLQVQSRRLGKLGYAKQKLIIRDFSGSALMLSDLQFYIEVTTENQSLLLPAVEKQNRLLAPYPYLKVRKRLPLFCYFEIYNLRPAGISESYEITYKVISNLGQESLFKKLSRWLAGEKETAISLSQAQPVVDEAPQELIALDLSSLSNGPHRLEITVTDAKNAKTKASVAREIIIE